MCPLRAGAVRWSFRDTLNYGKHRGVSIVPHTTSAWRCESWSARLSKPYLSICYQSASGVQTSFCSTSMSLPWSVPPGVAGCGTILALGGAKSDHQNGAMSAGEITRRMLREKCCPACCQKPVAME